MTLTLTISDLARGGAGVARDVNGRVIFVPFTAPGDKVTVRVTNQSKRYADGELIEILERSPIRIEPRCPAFGKCGGCQWQHLPYELQWKTKAGGVHHALKRIGLKVPEPGSSDWMEHPADNPWEYRNRIQLRIQKDQMGFYAARSHQLINLNGCPIARPEINEAWASIREQGLSKPDAYKVEAEILPSGELRTTWNAAHAASGFRQINDAQNEKLKTWVAKMLTPERELLDLFGGAGNLSLGIAEKMKRVDCVDISSPAEASTGNYHYHRWSVLPWLRKNSKMPRQARSAILDPPRAGLEDSLTGIANVLEEIGVNEIIAVGCDPDSWVSDLSKFSHRGWKIAAIATFDFFPQTPHVESAALLRI